MSTDPCDVMIERLATLGLVIEWSASMEHTLRTAFCSLVGSKQAAVVAGGQSTTWLIGQCKALVDVHPGLDDPARKAIKEALGLCEVANGRRNVLVHALKYRLSTAHSLTPVADGFLTRRSRPRTYLPAAQSWTQDELIDAATVIAGADSSLYAAMHDAVSKELMTIGEQLMAEHYLRESRWD